jgi:hypothetical protein
MSVPTSEVSYTLATTRKGDHKVHKGHAVAFRKKIYWGGRINPQPQARSYVYMDLIGPKRIGNLE